MYDFLLVYNCHVWYIFHYIGIRKVCVVKYLAAVFVTSLCTLSALLHIVQVNLSSWATCTDVRHKPSCFSVTTSSDVYRAVWSSYQKNSAEEFLQSDSEVSDYITIGDVSLGKLLFFFKFYFDFLLSVWFFSQLPCFCPFNSLSLFFVIEWQIGNKWNWSCKFCEVFHSVLCPCSFGDRKGITSGRVLL